MSDRDYFERESLRYIIRLAKGCPGAFKRSIDIDDLLNALKQRLTPEQYNEMLSEFLKITPTDEDLKQEVGQFVRRRHGCNMKLCWAIQDNHREAAEIFVTYLELAKSQVPETSFSSLAGRLRSVKDSLGLTDVEADLLQLLYFRCDQLGMFDDSFRQGAIWDAKNLPYFASAFLGVDAPTAQKLFHNEGPLRRLGLLVLASANREFEIHSETKDFLSGSKNIDAYVDSIFEPVGYDGAIPRPTSVDDTDWTILKGLLEGESGANILLYGPPGSGKTSLAKALSHDLKLNIIGVKNPQNGDQNARVTQLLCALAIAEKCPDKVVLVDESDRLLCTRYAFLRYGTSNNDKGWLNKILESCKSKVIWISNSISGVEPENLRRFSYAVQFKPASRKQRQEVWRSVLPKYPRVAAAISEEDISDFSARYELEAGHISDCVRQVENACIVDAEVKIHVKKHLESHFRRLNPHGSPKKQDWTTPCKYHSLDGLNADHDLNKVTATIGDFYRRLDADRNDMPIKNMNLLLSGHAGTGKTEFVKYLAKTLNRDLTIKVSSDLKSMYVGQSEKNLAAAFEEASKDGAILFIDEADSFLWSRENAKASWELSETNEFLSQMENFRGVLVCATNFMDRFDSAAVRRFNIKMRFDYLKPDGAALFFERCFRSLIGNAQMSDQQRRRLEVMNNLAPGDFKVAGQKYVFSEPGTVTVDVLLDALDCERKYKAGGDRRQIGFSQYG